MKDAFGKTLRLGDQAIRVSGNSGGSVSIQKVDIVGFTPQTVRVIRTGPPAGCKPSNVSSKLLILYTPDVFERD